MIKVLTKRLRSLTANGTVIRKFLDKTVFKTSKIKLETLCGITAVSYGILLFSAVAAAELDVGYSVNVNGVNYGTVSTKKEAQAILSSALSEISVQNSEFSYEKAGYNFSVMPKSAFSDADAVKEEIVSELGGLTFAYGISVDGEVVAALENEDEANSLVNEILNSYKTPDNTVSFVNNVEITGAKVKSSLVMKREQAAAVLTGSREQAVVHKVAEGETFSQIAENYGVSSETLMAINGGITPEKLQIGQELTVTAAVPLVGIRTVEQMTVTENIPYEVTKQQDGSMYKGIRKVTKSGVYGKKNVVYNVTKVNNQVVDKTQADAVILSYPQNEVVSVGTKVKPKTSSTGNFIRPYYGVVTSRFGARWGRNHNGVDYGGKIGDPVKAADGGTVTYAGWYSGYGNFIKISHGNGKETYYGHLSAINVKNGQKVAQGEVIGKVGNTGNSTGPHLHFEIRINGKPVNPLGYVG